MTNPTLKGKLLNGLLILSSLFGYLEWGTDNHAFLFESEWEVLQQLFTDPASAAHPFTLIPLLGQVLLSLTLFQQETSKTLTYFGIACLGLLLGLMFFIGFWEWNLKILFSTLPFVLVSILTIREQRRRKRARGGQKG